MEVEITRSYSQKVNLGNYQTADYHCSIKATCEKKDADKVSPILSQWCQDQVAADIKRGSLKRRIQIEKVHKYFEVDNLIVEEPNS